jgi:hypothetical protein
MGMVEVEAVFGQVNHILQEFFRVEDLSDLFGNLGGDFQVAGMGSHLILQVMEGILKLNNQLVKVTDSGLGGLFCEHGSSFSWLLSFV